MDATGTALYRSALGNIEQQFDSREGAAAILL